MNLIFDPDHIAWRIFGKGTDFYKSKFISFEITKAVELWLFEEL